jgi:hypothetical protein
MIVGTALLLTALKALGPNEFNAKTCAVYVLPVVRPVILMGEDEPVAVNWVPLEESVAVT